MTVCVSPQFRSKSDSCFVLFLFSHHPEQDDSVCFYMLLCSCSCKDQDQIKVVADINIFLPVL